MTPELRTARLVLAAPLSAIPYVRWLNDPEVVKFSEQRHYRHDTESQMKFFGSFDGITSHVWEIQLDGTPIGSLTAYINLPNRRAEIGILIGEKSEWGKGYGAEAWIAVMDWLASQGIEKMEAGCHPLNIGMMYVFARAKMELEARIHDHFLYEGLRCPMFRFGRLM
jgi:ribosomal-protein-alanine N-acetyltransferase